MKVHEQLGYSFQPLRVRAYLQTPVISSDKQLPLDGVLYALMLRDKIGIDARVITKSNDNGVREGQQIYLPLQKSNMREEWWYYKCSFAQFPDHAVEGNESYTKRFDVHLSDMIDFGKRKATVDTARGVYKAVHNKLYYTSALYVDWYCVGDMEAIRKLLRFATNIGKKTSQGWGAVLRWEVTKWHDDWHLRGPETKPGKRKLMRAKYHPQSNVICGMRPSYWLPKHQFPCVIPHPSGDGSVIM